MRSRETHQRLQDRKGEGRTEEAVGGQGERRAGGTAVIVKKASSTRAPRRDRCPGFDAPAEHLCTAPVKRTERSEPERGTATAGAKPRLPERRRALAQAVVPWSVPQAPHPTAATGRPKRGCHTHGAACARLLTEGGKRVCRRGRVVFPKQRSAASSRDALLKATYE